MATRRAIHGRSVANLKLGKAAAVLWLAFVTLTACVATAVIEPALKTPPLVDRLPVSVGVYYDEELQNYHNQTDIPTNQREKSSTLEFYLGPPSMALFDQVLASMFEKVVRVEGKPPSSPLRSPLVAVIELTIRNFQLKWPARAELDNISIYVAYHVNFYTPQGSTIASWFSSGEASWADTGCGGICYNMGGKVTSLAMRQAAARFMVDFYERPEIKDWLKGLGTTPEGMEGQEK